MFNNIGIYKMSIPFRESSIVLERTLLFHYFVIWLICLLFDRQQTRNVYSSSKPVNIKKKNVCALTVLFFVICLHEMTLSIHW